MKLEPTTISVPDRKIRVKIGLRWKLMLWLGVLFGGGLSTLVFLGISALTSIHEAHISNRLERGEHIVQSILTESTTELTLAAERIAADVRVAELKRREALRSDLLGLELSQLRIYSSSGQLVSALPAMATTTADSDSTIVAEVSDQLEPRTRITCQSDCLQEVFAPVFDADGQEFLIAVGRPLIDSLIAFAALSGDDIALIREGSQPIAAAMTNAPRVRGVVEAYLGDPNSALERVHDRRTFRLRRIEVSSNPPVTALILADVSQIQQAVRNQSARFLGLNAVALLLSGLLLYLLLTRILDRLNRVSRALPQLARQNFDRVRAEIPADTVARRAPDEVDVLQDATLALTDRLEALYGAEAANEAKSTFLATMSHELRTPLSALVSMLELHEKSELNPDQRYAVNVMRKSGMALHRMIDDLLDFAKIESGRLDLDPMSFCLRDLIEDAADAVSASAAQGNLKLIAIVDPQLPRRFVADDLRLRQVLLNLLSNALKFTEHGRVAVEAQRVLVSPASARVRFAVTDSGIGIAPEILPRLFQRFSQAETSTLRQYGGTGLGLAISKALVELMGATIKVNSTLGAGTRFSFEIDLPVDQNDAASEQQTIKLGAIPIQWTGDDDYEDRQWREVLSTLGAQFLQSARPGTVVFSASAKDGVSGFRVSSANAHVEPVFVPRPLRLNGILESIASVTGRRFLNEERAPPQRPAALAQVGQGLRVLVAEDQDLNRDVLVRQLQSIGCEVVAQASAQEALESFRHELAFDLVLTDLQMPGMDGLQLAAEIRALEESSKGDPVTIVLVSASAIEARGQPHLDGSMRKPVELERLSRLICEVSGRTVPAGISVLSDDPTDVERVFDPAAIAQVLGPDEQTWQKMYTQFFETCRDQMPRLRKQVTEAKLDDCQALAHKLCGSARTLGAKRMAIHLKSLEEGAEAGQLAASRDAMARVDSALAELRRELKARWSDSVQ